MEIANKLQSLFLNNVLLAMPDANEDPCVWWDPPQGIPARGLIDLTETGRAPILFINKNPGHAISDPEEQLMFQAHAGKKSILAAYNQWIHHRLLSNSKWPLARGIEWYATQLLGITAQETWQKYIISTNAVKVSTHEKTGKKIPESVYQRWLPTLLKEIELIQPAVILVGGADVSDFLKGHPEFPAFHYVTHPSWVPTPHGAKARNIIDRIHSDVLSGVEEWMQT